VLAPRTNRNLPNFSSTASQITSYQYNGSLLGGLGGQYGISGAQSSSSIQMTNPHPYFQNNNQNMAQNNQNWQNVQSGQNMLTCNPPPPQPSSPLTRFPTWSPYLIPTTVNDQDATVNAYWQVYQRRAMASNGALIGCIASIDSKAYSYQVGLLMSQAFYNAYLKQSQLAVCKIKALVDSGALRNSAWRDREEKEIGKRMNSLAINHNHQITSRTTPVSTFLTSPSSLTFTIRRWQY
jgi:hypothetical protein